MTVRVYKTVNTVRVSALGPQGSAGAAGQGVPAGGVTGQQLRKASNADYDTEWYMPATAPAHTFERAPLFDGAGSPPATGAGVQAGLTKSGTIIEAILIATDDAGDRVADTLSVAVSKVSSAGVETALGTIALAAESYKRDTVLSGWTTAVAAGDALRLELASGGAVATKLNLTLEIQGA